MSLRVRSFQIRDGEHAKADEDGVAAFLRAVEVDRIETSYQPGADAGWRLLVLYDDNKELEEAAQIASVTATALRQWRAAAAADDQRALGEVISDEAIARIAGRAPTTTPELRAILDVPPDQPVPYEEEIVRIVCRVLEDLS